MRFVAMDADVVAEAFTSRSDELAVCTFTSVSFLDSNRWEIQRRFPVSLDRNARIIFMPDDDSFWLVRDGRTPALHDTHTLKLCFHCRSAPSLWRSVRTGTISQSALTVEHLQLWDVRDLRKQLGELDLDWKPAAASPPLGGRLN